MKSFNGERNRLAHGLAEIIKKAIRLKKIARSITLKDILQSMILEKKRFSYYDVKNEDKLLKLLK